MQTLNEILESILCCKLDKTGKFSALKKELIEQCLPKLSALEIEPQWEREQKDYIEGIDVSKHVVVDNLRLKFNLDQIRQM